MTTTVDSTGSQTSDTRPGPTLPVSSSASTRDPRPSAWGALIRQPASACALVFLGVLVIAAIGAPWLAPYDPAAQDITNRFAGLSAQHWLGTDEFGRDVASRIIYAARVTLVAPLIALLVGVLLGVPAGLMSGVRRGIFDSVANKVSDTFLSIPAIVLALALVAVLGPSLVNAMIAIGIAFAPHLFRVVRSATAVVAEETYMSSAEAIGASLPRQLFVHVLPNIRAPLLVQVTLLMGFALLAEASLSFLGLGVQPPEASWGSMLKSAYENQFDAPFAVVPPGIALVLTILSFNVLGDGIRDVFSGGGTK